MSAESLNHQTMEGFQYEYGSKQLLTRKKVFKKTHIDIRLRASQM